MNTQAATPNYQEEEEEPEEEVIDTTNDFILPEPLWDYEVVTDWEKRIASYPAAKKKMYKFLISKVMELKKVCQNKEGWDTLVDDKNNNVFIECKK